MLRISSNIVDFSNVSSFAYKLKFFFLAETSLYIYYPSSGLIFIIIKHFPYILVILFYIVSTLSDVYVISTFSYKFKSHSLQCIAHAGEQKICSQNIFDTANV